MIFLTMLALLIKEYVWYEGNAAAGWIKRFLDVVLAAIAALTKSGKTLVTYRSGWHGLSCRVMASPVIILHC